MPEYDRDEAVAYAKRWAYARNPAYFSFDGLGGDCTNFASQCLYAGAKVMNYTPVYGWFYRSASDRTASWTGVEYLYNFLTANRGAGPYAEVAPIERLERGDLIQLGRRTGDFYHTLIVVSTAGPLVAAHADDAYGRLLSTYRAEVMRGLHILGVRT